MKVITNVRIFDYKNYIENGYVVFDKDYGKCVAWKINTSGTSPLGAYTVCPYHH
jgi:hypothetical protein